MREPLGSHRAHLLTGASNGAKLVAQSCGLAASELDSLRRASADGRAYAADVAAFARDQRSRVDPPVFVPRSRSDRAASAAAHGAYGVIPGLLVDLRQM